MRRRHLLLALCAVFSPPAGASAQQGNRRVRIGMLLTTPVNDPRSRRRIDTFRMRLRELGWADDQALRIDIHDFAGDPARLRANAMTLVASEPDVIVSVSDPALRTLLQLTRRIPIVFAIVADPVGNGLVASLNRPGGNATGFSNAESTIAGKWLELLQEIAPNATHIAVVQHPESISTASFGHALKTAAVSRGRELSLWDVRSAGDIEHAMAAAAGPRRAAVVLPNIVTSAHAALITKLAAQHRLPTVYPFPSFAAHGGLAAYGLADSDLFRHVAEYVDRILRGATPGELPIQEPTRLELVINLRAAKALGLTIPPYILARADEVIE